MKQKEPDWVQLARQRRKPLFSWNKIPGKKDSYKLIKFLRSGFVADLAEDAKVKKIDSRTIKVSAGKKKLSLELTDERTKVTLKIGKASYELIAKEKGGETNVYDRCVFFIRHTKKAEHIPEKHRKALCNRKFPLIAIDFGNRKITKSVYEKADVKTKSALNILSECCDNGAIVCAEYSYDRNTRMVLGKIDPQIIKKRKILGKTIYNTVKLKRARKITAKAHPETYELLTAIRSSRQGTTARYNPSSKKIVEAIFNREPLPREVSSLTPAQLEVLCYEYLKKNELLDALLLPIGRTLQYVDISGITKHGKNIKAQVTHQNKEGKLAEKIEDLKKYEHNAKLFFFLPKNKTPKKRIKGVKFVAIEKAFKKLDEDKHSIYPKMIEAMLPRDYLKK